MDTQTLNGYEFHIGDKFRRTKTNPVYAMLEGTTPNWATAGYISTIASFETDSVFGTDGIYDANGYWHHGWLIEPVKEDAA